MEVTLSTGVELLVNTISNISLFTLLSKLELVIPQVPVVVLDDGREMENPHHPVYADAVMVYTADKSDKIFDLLIQNCLTIDDKWLKLPEWLEIKDYFEMQDLIKLHDDEKVNFIKYYACQTEEDRNLITNIAVLCEKRVAEIFSAVTVTKDGIDITKTGLKHAVTTNIAPETIIIGTTQLVNPLDEYSACQAANLSWVDWIRNQYTLDEKACCVALYRMDKNIELHSSDVVAEHSEKEARRKNNK